MSRKDPPELADALSAEELKIRLYNKFRDKGILKEMRSQLRNRLLTELHSVCRIDNTQEDELLVRITNWFVSEHLQKCKYYSSLSVFAMESKSLDNSQNLITLKDALNLLQVYPETKIYKNIMEAESNQNHSSVLCLILRLMGAELDFQKKKRHIWQEERSVQTETTELQSYSFHHKLQEIENLYTLKKGIQKIEDEKSFEFQLMKYQQQLEEKIRKEAKDEVNLFKEKEMLKIKLEIENRSIKENQEYRRQLEQDYQEKFAALIEKEKKDIKDLNILKENVEKEIYLQRQEVLEHLEAARQKEMEIQKFQKKFQEEHNLENERLKLYEQRLKILENNLLEEKHQIDNKIKATITKERLQEQLEHDRKIKEINDERERLSLLEKQLTKEKQLLVQMQTDNNASVIEIHKLQEKLLEYQNENFILKQEKTLIEGQLKNFPDVNDLKSECNLSKSIIKKLETLLEETEKERNSLKIQLNDMKNMQEIPSPELLRMKQEVKMLQDSHNLDKAVWEEHKARLENQLKLSQDQSQQLSFRLEQQSLLGKELQDRIQELQFQIQQIYKQNFKLSGGTEIQNKFVETTLTNEQGTFFDTTINPHTVPLELQLLHDNSTGDNLFTSAVESSSILSPNKIFLHQSHYRMLALQKEADYLEKYSDRLKHATSSLKVFPDKHSETALDSQISSSLQKLDTIVHPKETINGKYSYSSKIDVGNFSESNFNVGVPSLNSTFDDIYLFSAKKVGNQTLPYTNTFSWDFSHKSNLIESSKKPKSKTNLSVVNESEDVLHSTLLIDEDNNFNKLLLAYDKVGTNAESVTNEINNVEKHDLRLFGVGQLKINQFTDDLPLINESVDKNLVQNKEQIPVDINLAENPTQLGQTNMRSELQTVDSDNGKTCINQNDNDVNKDEEKCTNLKNDVNFDNRGKMNKMIDEMPVSYPLEENNKENVISHNNIPDEVPQQIDLEAQWRMRKGNTVMHDENPFSTTTDNNGVDKNSYQKDSTNSVLKNQHNLGAQTVEASKEKTDLSSPKNSSEINNLSDKDASVSNASILDNIEHFSVGNSNTSLEDDW